MILKFDFKSAVPIYMQLRNQIVIGIADGSLKPGEHLPSVRALADESGINAMTVSKSYQLLKQEGYINTDRRRGTTVCEKNTAPELPGDTVERLRLCISELRFAGFKNEDISTLCRNLCEEEIK